MGWIQDFLPILWSFPLGILANWREIHEESEKWMYCVRWIPSGPQPVGLMWALHHHMAWDLFGKGKQVRLGQQENRRHESSNWIIIPQRGMYGLDGFCSCSVGLCSIRGLLFPAIYCFYRTKKKIFFFFWKQSCQ